MLSTTIADACRNDYLSDRFRAAFAFLRRDDLDTIACGRHDIDGDAVFANVMEVDTVPASEKDYEAHRAYYDVQYVVSGEELICVTPTQGLEPAGEWDEQGDFGLFHGRDVCTSVPLRAGDLVVVGPEDAHKPACQLDGPCHERKVVVKVAIDR
ncbi:MAG: YhcH/YjgK/YiaL family protein [Atopobiaceae bacterium]|jgi:YhcH/YjgK/YiaL family protein|nr:YhcH/YjgK/YiaL family protein [Atopobiaceae bacterium]MCI2172930.1 YhcH/YjgK/YiaL family protein [Atopobiaceae bacterium]MCI2208335.1 YhcH/YjgK/YiaL family protein [Atopobiaceae bacterium]